jgi:hypothetical protein
VLDWSLLQISKQDSILLLILQGGVFILKTHCLEALRSLLENRVKGSHFDFSEIPRNENLTV